MGETVSFASNGDTAGGYLATPESGSGPGVIVLQEWWGLNPQIKGVADRLAGEGFVALAPDLYRGELAEHTEMDKAAQLMTALPADRAARDMGGAVDYLLGLDATTGSKVGAIGFCMGGMLTFLVAAGQGDKIGAAVPFYGAPLNMEVDWSQLSAPIEGHFAENEDFFKWEGVSALGDHLKSMGKTVSFNLYPGTGHAFANETDALGTYDKEAADLAWSRALDFLHAKLNS